MDNEKLIGSFKASNQSLRKRVVTIGVLMILAIGLRYSEDKRLETVTELMDYQYKLKTIIEFSDSTFRKTIDRDSKEYAQAFLDDDELFDSNGEELAHLDLFEKIKFERYDKKIMRDGIEAIDTKIEQLNEDKSINILGVSVPIEPISYITLIFVFILFHDFTQIIIYRNQVYQKITEGNISKLELGFEFFGLYNGENGLLSKFLRITSSIIVGVFVLCPLATSLIMINLTNIYSDILVVINLICFFLIVIDTGIIFYSENLLNFRFISHLFFGKK